MKITIAEIKNKEQAVRKVTQFLTDRIGNEYQHLSMAFLLGEIFAYTLSKINEIPKSETGLLNTLMGNPRIADASGVYSGIMFAGATSSLDSDETIEVEPISFEVSFQGRTMRPLEFADAMHELLVNEQQALIH